MKFITLSIYFIAMQNHLFPLSETLEWWPVLQEKIGCKVIVETIFEAVILWNCRRH